MLGTMWIGRFLGDQIQKPVHQVFGVKPVSLPYDHLQIIRPIVGMVLSMNPKLFQAKSIYSISVTPTLEFNFAPNLYSSYEFKLPFQVKHLNHSISLGIGYKHINTIINNSVLDQSWKKESGMTVDFKMSAGRFFYFFKAFPQQQFSYGGFGMHIIQPKNNIHSKLPNIALEAGNTTNGSYYIRGIATSKNIDPHMMFTFTNTFGTLLKKDMVDHPKIQGHFQQIILASRFYMFKIKSKLQLNPIFEIGLGYRKVAVYSGSEINFSQLKFYSPEVKSAAGVQLTFKTPALNNQTLYGLVFMVNYSHPLIQQPITQTLLNHSYHLIRPNQSLSLGLIVYLNR